MELQSIINDAGTTRPIVEITVQPFGSSEGGEQCFEVENVGICTGLAWAEEQAASFTDKLSSTCKNKGVETPPFNETNLPNGKQRIDLSLFVKLRSTSGDKKCGGNQVYTIHTEADDEKKIAAEDYPHDDKFTHLINADLLHHAPELVAELRRMYEREDNFSDGSRNHHGSQGLCDLRRRR